MSRLSFAVLLTCGIPIGVVAQEAPSAPTLIFTIHAGVAGGHSLWTVPRQPICNTSGGTCSGSSYDTLRIARSVGSGITAGLSVSYFPGPHLGYYGEAAFVGLSLDDNCSGVYFAGGPGSVNDVLCQAVTGTSITMGAVSFLGGVTLRAGSLSGVSPYAVLGGGLLAFSQSTLDMSGAVIVTGSGPERLSIVVDNSPARVSPVATLGVGLRVRSGAAYGVRLGIEDLVAKFQRLQGPVNALGQGPVTSKFYHHVVVRLGLDVVLERKRGRRY
jgi:hypothetical protein